MNQWHFYRTLTAYAVPPFQSTSLQLSRGPQDTEIRLTN